MQQQLHQFSFSIVPFVDEVLFPEDQILIQTKEASHQLLL
jgi:hypothetical protein